MEIKISEDTKAIRNTLIQFVKKEVLPLEDENKKLFESERNYYDENGVLISKVRELKRQIRMKSAEVGLYNYFGSEKLGGSGGKKVDLVHLYEALYRQFGPDRLLIEDQIFPAIFSSGLSRVLEFLPKDLQDKYLPGIRSGEKTLCFGFTEPEAGSDAWNMKSTAKKEGDHWIINGEKRFISNGMYADYCMLFAVTDPELVRQHKGGITGFFVETSWSGFNPEVNIPVMGSFSGKSAVISIDNLKVPNSHIIGEINQGLKLGLSGISDGRIAMAAKALGSSEWGLDKAVEYANIRKTFGKTIGEYGQIQIHLADSATEIMALKSLLLNVASRIDEGRKTIAETSMAKYFGTETVQRVFDRAINVFGGIGLTNEVGLEKGYRWARISRIPDGTAEIHRRNIATRLLKGKIEF